MKKTALILITAVVLLAFALTACGQTATTAATTAAATTAAETTAAPAETSAASASGLRLGFGSVVTASKSASVTADKEGIAESYSYYVAVLIDADSKIQNVWIDSVVHRGNFDATGALTSDITAAGATKRELGDAYGMKKASPIGKEWWEQSDALEAYFVGKTVADIDTAAREGEKNIFVDLKTSSTFGPDHYVEALKKAVAAAEKATPTAATKLGYGASINSAKSANAAADKDGKFQSYNSMAIAAIDDSGKVLDVWIDSVVHDITFNAKGELTSDAKALGATKRELGDAYGMKKASAIGKEWWEQADALEAYLEGKTMAEIEGAAREGDKNIFVDLKTSSTFGPDHYIEALEKAVTNAQ
ncbi:MAG: hypothetical protein EOM08_10285 [Clostridia bacterium]|nr:hypothetical protein [Clostridia bacterium]NCC76808.1 hypothetical protein [Clostridia bacterium]